MRMRNLIFLLAFLFLLAVVQTSFLPHFPLLGIVPNIMVFAVLAVNFFDSALGAAAGLWGGFLLDVFSLQPFGFWVAILLVGVLIFNGIFKRYVQLPITH